MPLSSSLPPRSLSDCDSLSCLFVIRIPFLHLFLSDAVIEKGMRFALREGGRTVGAGVVTKVLPRLTPQEKEDKLKKQKEARQKKGEASEGGEQAEVCGFFLPRLTFRDLTFRFVIPFDLGQGRKEGSP
jgi:hypothetical protein